MRIVKKNIRWIILVIVLMIIVSGISVYATSTYLASQVTYKEGKTVEQALNDLYSKSKNITYEIWGSGTFTNSTGGIAKTKIFSVNQGVKKIVIYVSVSSVYGAENPSVSGDIISKQSVTQKSSGIRAGKFASNFYEIVAETNGNAGDVTLNISIGGTADGNTADAVIIYEN